MKRKGGFKFTVPKDRKVVIASVSEREGFVATVFSSQTWVLPTPPTDGAVFANELLS